MTRRNTTNVGVAVALAVAAVVGSACGGSTTSSAASSAVGPEQPGTTAGSSTYEIVPDAVVTAGLATVRSQAAQIKATLPTSQTDAQAQTKQMYDTWFGFEGTIRKNEKALYLQMEDGLAAVKAGVEQNNPQKVDKGITDLEEGASAYVAKHTG